MKNFPKKLDSLRNEIRLYFGKYYARGVCLDEYGYPQSLGYIFDSEEALGYINGEWRYFEGKTIQPKYFFEISTEKLCFLVSDFQREYCITD